MGRVAPALENLSPDLVRRGGTDRRRVSLMRSGRRACADVRGHELDSIRLRCEDGSRRELFEGFGNARINEILQSVRASQR